MNLHVSDIITGSFYAVYFVERPIGFTELTRFVVLFHRLLGNCPPTPPLSQHFGLSEKKVFMLA